MAKVGTATNRRGIRLAHQADVDRTGNRVGASNPAKGIAAAGTVAADRICASQESARHRNHAAAAARHRAGRAAQRLAALAAAILAAEGSCKKGQSAADRDGARVVNRNGCLARIGQRAAGCRIGPARCGTSAQHGIAADIDRSAIGNRKQRGAAKGVRYRRWAGYLACSPDPGRGDQQIPIEHRAAAVADRNARHAAARGCPGTDRSKIGAKTRCPQIGGAGHHNIAAKRVDLCQPALRAACNPVEIIRPAKRIGVDQRIAANPHRRAAF